MKMTTDESYFSGICIDKCRGKCCDPWWGIISFGIKKENGLNNLKGFRNELIKNLATSMERIQKGYITNERPPRPLLNKPERYNAVVRDIRLKGSVIEMTILAMYAFRCQFLSSDKKCLLHPAVTGGEDVRPPHCGFMGSPNAVEGEKGYCRIIQTALKTSEADAIEAAIKTEQEAGKKHFENGCFSIDEAAENIIMQIQAYCSSYAASLLPTEKKDTPGRNEACYCGSGRKYKKCHGC